MTYEVQQNRWDQLIRRVSGSIGPGSRVNETLSELFPVLDVERVPGELLILGGTRLAFGSATIVGAALEIPNIQLFNPVDSGFLITVTKVILNSPTAVVTLRWTVNDVALAGLGLASRFRDTRFGVGGLPAGQIRLESLGGAFLTATGQFELTANREYTLTDENDVAVLAPGTGLQFATDVVVSRLVATFHWRERVAEQSELNL